jgi:hypothetical protein
MLATASLRNNAAKSINGMKLWRHPTAAINRSGPFDRIKGEAVEAKIKIL